MHISSQKNEVLSCEHIIVLTDGQYSYIINVYKERDVKCISFKLAQSYIKQDCRIVELDSYEQIEQFSRDGFRLGFPSDKNNWHFFSEQ